MTQVIDSLYWNKEGLKEHLCFFRDYKLFYNNTKPYPLCAHNPLLNKENIIGHWSVEANWCDRTKSYRDQGKTAEKIL